MTYQKIVTILVFAALVIGVGYYAHTRRGAPSVAPPTPSVSPTTAASTPPAATPSATLPASSPKAPLVAPLDRASERVTKKPFGIYITKANSPVQPERFSGYHTGVDFETFPEEQSTDVVIHVVCSGQLLQKRTATGYGGVAVQACTINGQAVTIIYGHMRLSSIQASVNQQLSAGDKLGVLGTGYSKETDGERKHLHLGIHKGPAVNILGYVQNKSALANWLDARTLGNY